MGSGGGCRRRRYLRTFMTAPTRTRRRPSERSRRWSLRLVEQGAVDLDAPCARPGYECPTRWPRSRQPNGRCAHAAGSRRRRAGRRSGFSYERELRPAGARVGASGEDALVT
ncbi:MAG: hypothetical protein ACLSVD_16100 [Eggerthellaceae bacterium]